MCQQSDNTKVAFISMINAPIPYFLTSRLCQDRRYRIFLKNIKTPTRCKCHNVISKRVLTLPDNKNKLFILLIIFLLISISNSSLKNPGPTINVSNNAHGLSIFYQNVQGLIPFTELNKKHPNLDNTKLAELHAYVYEKQPDIIVLNETWLKSTISDEEILPRDKYRIMRCDRSEHSHPPDPNNSLNFRRNGGGVLIAISCLLKVSSKVIDLKCKAEILAAEIILNDGSKIVISTCHRVGTLGTLNYYEIVNALQKLLRKKRLKKFYTVGDFNFCTTNWETNTSKNKTEQMFIDEFISLGLIQCISTPDITFTHSKGNIWDLVLINSDNYK